MSTCDHAPLAVLVAALPVRCEAVLRALLKGGEVGTMLPHDETIAHALLAAGLVERDADGMRLWTMSEVDRLGAATHQGGPLEWLRTRCGLEPSAPIENDGVRCLEALYAFKRATLGREPTLGELGRWAGTYEATAAALRKLVAWAREQPEMAPTPTRSTVRARAGSTGRAAFPPFPTHVGKRRNLGTWDTTRVVPPPGALTPEQVLAQRPLTPPGRTAR